jgi:hypothetical protein
VAKAMQEYGKRRDPIRENLDRAPQLGATLVLLSSSNSRYPSFKVLIMGTPVFDDYPTLFRESFLYTFSSWFYQFLVRF